MTHIIKVCSQYDEINLWHQLQKRWHQLQKDEMKKSHNICNPNIILNNSRLQKKLRIQEWEMTLSLEIPWCKKDNKNIIYEQASCQIWLS